MQDAYDTNKDDLSRQGSLTSVSSVNPDQGMTIIDGGFPLENDSQTKKLSNALRKKGWKLSYERRKWHFKEWRVNSDLQNKPSINFSKKMIVKPSLL